MNFIEGSVAEDGASFLANDGTTLALGTVPQAARGRKVVLGVRPEHLRLNGPGAAAAEVVVTEPTGSETYVVATLAGVDVTFVLKERTSLVAGQRIMLSVAEAPTHVFDPQTSLRIS